MSERTPSAGDGDAFSAPADAQPRTAADGVDAYVVPTRRLHPLSPITTVPISNLVYAGVAGGLSGSRVLAGLLVVLLGVAWLQWWRRQLSVAGGVVRIDEGVVVRKQQLIPCDRIQEVALVQTLRDRLFNLATLRIRIASGDGAVSLASLSQDDAEDLRHRLLALRGGSDRPIGAGGVAADAAVVPDGPWVPAAHRLIEVSYPRLVVHGLTGGTLLIVLAFLAPAMELLDALGSASDSPLGDTTVVVATVILFLGGAVLWFGAAVVASLLQYGGFSLELVGDELHARYGLLDRRQVAMPLDRIQAVEVAAPLPRRWLGFASLIFRSAGRGGGATNRMTVPIVREDEIGPLLTTVLRRAAELPDLVPAPPVARRRAVVRHAAPLLVMAAAAAVVWWPWGLVGLVAVVPGWAAGVAAHRGLGHAVAEGFLIARRGWLLRSTAVVPVTRPQSAAVKASPFQRRLGLATTVVHLAGPGRDPRVIDQSEEVARSLLAHLVDRTGGGSGTAG